MFLQKKTFRFLVVFARIIAGLIFIFSGFVKAIDPLGSTYKFSDYFEAFKLVWLDPLALPLAFILSGLEFLIGICLLISVQKRLANWGALLFMVVFTPLTLWLALFDPVQDCGCFGDALILSNWQTFYKNIIILLLVVISFVGIQTFGRWLKTKFEWLIIIIFAVLITAFSFYNLGHLPVIDFRPYKVGTYIPDKMVIPIDAPVDEYEQIFTLLDTISGKQINIEGQVYFSDSTYWGTNTIWKYIASEPKLIKKGYTPPIHDFTITTLDGFEITNKVLTDASYCFILIAYDLNNTKTENLPHINSIYEQSINDHYKFICLTSVSNKEIITFKKTHHAGYEFYITDPITLKTIVRANPGLILLHKGTILAKWHSNDIPSYKKIKQQYIHN